MSKLLLGLVVLVVAVLIACGGGGGDKTIDFKVTVDGTPIATVQAEWNEVATVTAVYDECLKAYEARTDTYDARVGQWNALSEANDPVYLQYTIGGPIGTGFEGWAADRGYPTEPEDSGC